MTHLVYATTPICHMPHREYSHAYVHQVDHLGNTERALGMLPNALCVALRCSALARAVLLCAPISLLTLRSSLQLCSLYPACGALSTAALNRLADGVMGALITSHGAVS